MHRRQQMIPAVALLCLAATSTAFASIGTSLQGSCTASDGSCSATVTCPAGCGALCTSGGTCSSKCFSTPNGNSLAGPQDHQTLVSIHTDVMSAAEVARLLHEQTGADVAFTPRDPKAVVQLHVDGVPLQEVVQFLAKGGAAIAVNQQGERITLSIQGARAGAISSLLSDATSGRMSFSASDPEQVVSLDIKDAPLEFFLNLLAPLGAVHLAPKNR